MGPMGACSELFPKDDASYAQDKEMISPSQLVSIALGP